MERKGETEKKRERELYRIVKSVRLRTTVCKQKKKSDEKAKIDIQRHTWWLVNNQDVTLTRQGEHEQVER